MIQHAYPHYFANFPQPSRDVEVLGARGRIAARVIVNEDDRGCGLTDHRIVNLPWMNQ